MIDLLFNLTYKECTGWENQEKGDNSLTCFILQCKAKGSPLNNFKTKVSSIHAEKQEKYID
jgi:hypothetical protein